MDKLTSDASKKDLKELIITLHDIARQIEVHASFAEVGKDIRFSADKLSSLLKQADEISA